MPFPGGELTFVARFLSAFRKLLRRPEPTTVLKYRERLREEIRQKLEWPGSGVPEIVVVRLSKKDKYPDTDSLFFGLFGASPWFKYEVKRVHDRGLEVYAGIQRVTIRKRKARRSDLGKAPKKHGDERKVWVVGRIPYERIGHIDWEPDPYYSVPRFYVNYGWGGPFREVVLYEQSSWAGERERRPGARPDGDLLEIHDVEYQGEAGNPWRWLRYTGSRLRFSLATRRQERRDRKEFPP